MFSPDSYQFIVRSFYISVFLICFNIHINMYWNFALCSMDFYFSFLFYCLYMNMILWIHLCMFIQLYRINHRCIMFVCLGLYVEKFWEMFTHLDTSPFPVKGYKDLCSALMAIELTYCDVSQPFITVTNEDQQHSHALVGEYLAVVWDTLQYLQGWKDSKI